MINSIKPEEWAQRVHSAAAALVLGKMITKDLITENGVRLGYCLMEKALEEMNFASISDQKLVSLFDQGSNMRLIPARNRTSNID